MKKEQYRVVCMVISFVLLLSLFSGCAEAPYTSGNNEPTAGTEENNTNSPVNATVQYCGAEVVDVEADKSIYGTDKMTLSPGDAQRLRKLLGQCTELEGVTTADGNMSLRSTVRNTVTSLLSAPLSDTSNMTVKYMNCLPYTTQTFSQSAELTPLFRE